MRDLSWVNLGIFENSTVKLQIASNLATVLATWKKREKSHPSWLNKKKNTNRYKTN